ncbi:MAG: hypothetical protein M1839_004802 [Geoglossum umbratile]|nr:MAG: hypothetical protein M1839_004802 [Geoglossum umbratile]
MSVPPSPPEPSTHRRRESVAIPTRRESLSAGSTVAEIKERDDTGQTPLHLAAGKGNCEAVKLLLENGAEKGARDYKKQIPLHLAASSGDFDTVLGLVGPRMITVDKNGLNAADKYGQTPLHVAARDGHHQIVQLLISEGANKEARAVDSRTPLHVAASRGKSEVVRALVWKGANKGAKDSNDQTPLHLASENGDCDTIRELLGRGTSTAPLPQSTTEYWLYARDFVAGNLRFPGFDNAYVTRLARRASAGAKEVTSRWGLSEETTPKLIKLAFYDFIFLCGLLEGILDDSDSMNQSDRKRLLLNTLGSVASFATLLEPTGITVRFINYNTDDTFNKMVNVNEIVQRVGSINFDGGTKLGTTLDDKIVQPMILDKAKKRRLEKPVIVVIITDGEASFLGPIDSSEGDS